MRVPDRDLHPSAMSQLRGPSIASRMRTTRFRSASVPFMWSRGLLESLRKRRSVETKPNSKDPSDWVQEQECILLDTRSTRACHASMNIIYRTQSGCSSAPSNGLSSTGVHSCNLSVRPRANECNGRPTVLYVAVLQSDQTLDGIARRLQAESRRGQAKSEVALLIENLCCTRAHQFTKRSQGSRTLMCTRSLRTTTEIAKVGLARNLRFKLEFGPAPQLMTQT